MSFRLPRSLSICSSMFPSAARARLPPTHYTRSFFSLPDLSPLLGNKSPSDPNQEQHYREEKVFPYTPEQLYTVVAHIPSYKSFIPFCTSSRIVSGSPGLGDEPFEIEAELKVGFMGFEEGYVSKVKGIPFESVQAIASETPLFKTLVTTWTFHPPARLAHQRASTSTLPSSQMSPTMVTLDLRYSFNNPSHATASSMFFGGVSEMMVNAFEKRCRDLYGPR
ncbi:Oligoketide cyclase/lipid transport protein [Phaffia rhodozyma]|uniref:Oligoketide cyclase/lipid transport protein n=1 Tax=Phaffia rhodozyma TaxID=264483 RepID=A0A0F7SNI0_PHARH|nr:Oligoketide cyclase/lipid transport protein [Phaffia rhodozyma]